MFLFWGTMSTMVAIAAAILFWPLLKLKMQIGYFIIAVLPFFALFLYLHWGASKQYEQFWLAKEQAKIVDTALAKIHSPQQIINQLTAHLAQHPQSAEGWYLLGRLYLGLQRYDSAQHSFETAFHLQPKKTSYAIGYAEAVFFNHHEQLTQTAQQLLVDVLKQSPSNVPVIHLLGLNAYNQKKYAIAVQYWEKLIPLFPEGSSDSQVVLKMIALAQKKLEITHQ
jgi:cytochrome c-type biogenesis protein CcmH